MYSALKRQQTLGLDGSVHGFELLVMPGEAPHAPPSDSWLCLSLEKGASDHLGVATNRYGLIDTFGDAMKVVDCIERDTFRAEPGAWLPWLLIQYSVPR